MSGSAWTASDEEPVQDLMAEEPVLDPDFFEPDIPRLKPEEEKERKGAGIGWLPGSGSPGPLGVPAQVGSRAPGLLGSARIAAVLSRLLGGSSTFLGGLFASQLGPSLALGLMLTWGGLLAYAAVRLMDAVPAPAVEALLAGRPGDIPGSGIFIDRPKNRSLDYLAYANRGELAYDDGAPVEAKKDAPADQPPAAPETTAPDAPAIPVPPEAAALMAGKTLNPEGFIQKMTQDPGQLIAGGRLAGEGGLRDALAAANKAQAQLPQSLGLTKDSAALRRTMQALTGRKVTGGNRSGNAMSQLKFARNMSSYGANSSADGKARQYTTDAFEQGKTIGGGMPGVGGDGIVVPPGDGAPGISEDLPEDTVVPPSQNVTPYQQPLDNSKKKNNNALILYILGAALLAMGTVLSLIGYKLMSNPATETQGALLLGLGIAMIIAGIGCIIGGALMANSAKGDGKNISKNYGQQQQGQIVNNCANEAQNGVSSGQCQ